MIKINFLLISCAFVLCFVVGCSGKSKVVALKPGEPAPYTRFTLLNGSYRALDELRGKTVVLVFWAQWCSKSGQLMEKLNRLSNKLADRKDIIFVAASVDKSEDAEKLKAAIRDRGFTHMAHAFSGNEGEDEAYQAFRCGELPEVFVINPQGTVIASGNNIDVVEQALKVS